jgi:hypothetical protein
VCLCVCACIHRHRHTHTFHTILMGGRYIRVRSRCVDCGGKGICEHKRIKRQCKVLLACLLPCSLCVSVSVSLFLCVHVYMYIQYLSHTPSLVSLLAPLHMHTGMWRLFDLRTQATKVLMQGMQGLITVSTRYSYMQRDKEQRDQDKSQRYSHSHSHSFSARERERETSSESERRMRGWCVGE